MPNLHKKFLILCRRFCGQRQGMKNLARILSEVKHSMNLSAVLNRLSTNESCPLQEDRANKNNMIVNVFGMIVWHSIQQLYFRYICYISQGNNVLKLFF